MELAPLTVLKKRYTIKRTLGDPGPFDIKYLGQDVDSKDPFVIREFFPAHLVKRESDSTSIEVKGDDDNNALVQSGMEYFQKESEVLQQLSHTSLPSGYETFEANGTVYRVRPHLPSMSLASGLESRDALSEKAALTILIPILEALQEAHDSGLYHGGVSPHTIRLLEDGNVLLTGFRGAFIQLARQGGELSRLVQDGTSAIEQYTPRGNQGPWTDVYAAAATFCQMVTGETMPKASSRLEGEDPLMALIQDADVFSSPGVREALVDALTVDPSKRLQSADALATALRESSTRYDGTEEAYTIIPTDEGDEAAEEDGSEDGDDEEVEVLSTNPNERGRRAPRRSSRSKKDEGSNTGILVGALLLAVVLGGGGFYFLTGGGGATGSYADYRSRADSLYASQDYEQAQRYYQQALDAREGDQYVLDRLDQIEEQMGSDQYQQFISRGDSLVQIGNQALGENQLASANNAYTKAIAAYFSAQDARPQSDEVEQKISSIESRQEQIARRQLSSGGGNDDASVEEIANFFRDQGDEQLRDGNPRAALRKYRQASEFLPDDRALQRTIAGLEEEIQSQQQNRAYADAMERGNQLLRQQQYADAKTAFENAADIKPNDRRAQDAVTRADSLMRSSQETQETYDQYRAEGDAAYQQGNYEEAIAAYQQALQAKPSDGYAEEQLSKAQSELEEMQLAQSKMQKEEERTSNMVDEDGIYKVVDQEPSVKGGLSALHKKVRYPDAAARRGVEGRVYVEAIVNADGSVRDSRVTRGIGAGCDREARRVVESAEFNPATVNGKPVPARTTVWIQFALQS